MANPDYAELGELVDAPLELSEWGIRSVEDAKRLDLDGKEKIAANRLDEGLRAKLVAAYAYEQFGAERDAAYQYAMVAMEVRNRGGPVDLVTSLKVREIGLWRRTGSFAGVANEYMGLGTYLQRQGDWEAAVPHFRRAAEFYGAVRNTEKQEVALRHAESPPP